MAGEVFLPRVSSSVCVQVRGGGEAFRTNFTNMFLNFVVDMFDMVFHNYICCEDFSTINTFKPGAVHACSKSETR